MMIPDGMEPTYATVKRTARSGGLRSNGDSNGSGCHMYQYPCTINGTTGLVTIATDSCCETDSCLSYDNTNSNGQAATTAFLRLHEPSDHLLGAHHY